MDAEVRLHEPAVRRDRAAVDALLAPDFVEFGSSGLLWSREEMLDSIAHFESSTSTRLTVVGMRAQQLAPDLVLVTYLSEIGERRARRSSIWRVTPDGPRVVFHQGTIIT